MSKVYSYRLAMQRDEFLQWYGLNTSTLPDDPYAHCDTIEQLVQGRITDDEVPDNCYPKKSLVVFEVLSNKPGKHKKVIVNRDSLYEIASDQLVEEAVKAKWDIE